MALASALFLHHSFGGLVLVGTDRTLLHVGTCLPSSCAAQRDVGKNVQLTTSVTHTHTYRRVRRSASAKPDCRSAISACAGLFGMREPPERKGKQGETEAEIKRGRANLLIRDLQT